MDTLTWSGHHAYTIGPVTLYDRCSEMPMFLSPGARVWSSVKAVLDFYLKTEGAVQLDTGTWIATGIYLLEMENIWEFAVEVEGPSYGRLKVVARVRSSLCTHIKEASSLGLSSPREDKA